MFEKSEAGRRLQNCFRASGSQQRLPQRRPGRSSHFCVAPPLVPNVAHWHWHHPATVQVVRRAEFSPGSSLSADLTDFSLSDQVDVSLGFKSSQTQGLILQDRQQVSRNVCFGKIPSVCHRSPVLTLLILYVPGKRDQHWFGKWPRGLQLQHKRVEIQQTVQRWHVALCDHD